MAEGVRPDKVRSIKKKIRPKSWPVCDVHKLSFNVIKRAFLFPTYYLHDRRVALQTKANRIDQ